MGAEKLVVDASVLVKWVVPEEYSDDARRIRDDFLEGRVLIHVPCIALLEASSALRKYVVRGFTDDGTATEALRLLVDSGIRIEPLGVEDPLSALSLSLDAGITVYDAYYVSLARKLDAPLVTADEKLLQNKKVRKLVRVLHITEYHLTI